MSYVFQRSGVWFLGYRDEAGVQVRVKAPEQSKAKAKAYAAELEVRAKKVRMGLVDAARKPHTWGEVCNRYLSDVVPTLRSPASARTYVTHYIQPAFAKRYLHDLSPGECETWTRLRVQGKRRPFSLTTREHIRVLASAVYGWAVKLGWAVKDKNPWRGWRVSFDKKKPKYLTEPEVRAILAGADERVRALFAVALFCGLRKGELAGLLWENVHPTFIHVCKSYGGPTKSGRVRDVAIPSECRPFIEAQRARTGAKALVFPSPRGRMYSPSWDASKEFKAALASVGITRTDVTFRTQRSTFGTHYTKHTGDLTATQDALGHANFAVTKESYAAAIPEHRMEQGRRFSYGLLPAGSPEDAEWSLAGPAPTRNHTTNGSLRMETDSMTDECVLSDGTDREASAKRRYAPPEVTSRTWRRGDGAAKSLRASGMPLASPRRLPGGRS